MTERRDFDRRVPDDLSALDAELSSIRYEERPSFGPELRAELALAWSAPRGRSRSLRRGLAAAALTTLLLVAAVPGARGSLVRLVGVLQSAPELATEPPAAPTPIQVGPIDPTPAVLGAADEPLVDRVPPTDDAGVAVLVGASGLEFPTAPRVLDRVSVEALLQAAYPVALQEGGVGGSVALRMWVDSLGQGERVSVARGSGVEELDRIAQSVALLLEFEPAMLGGRAVGTWIEFSVRFEPHPEPKPRPGPLDHRIQP